MAGDSRTSSPKSSRCASPTEHAEVARIEAPLAEDKSRAADELRAADAPTGACADKTSTGRPAGPDAGPDAASSAAEVALACQPAAPTSGRASLQGVTQGSVQGAMLDSGDFEVWLLRPRHTATRRTRRTCCTHCTCATPQGHTTSLLAFSAHQGTHTPVCTLRVLSPPLPAPHPPCTPTLPAGAALSVPSRHQHATSAARGRQPVSRLA